MKKSVLSCIALLTIAMLPVQINAQDCNEPSITNATVTFRYSSAAPAGVYSANAVFTVAPQKQVYFTKGNLQYTFRQITATTFNQHTTLEGLQSGEFRFAPHQYDMADPTVFDPFGELGKTIPWQDVFGYGTSGVTTTSGAVFDGYSTNAANLPVSSTNDPKLLDKDLTGTYVRGDWGVFNTILDGETETTGWRTLTKDEWQYLITNSKNGLCQIQVDGSLTVKGAFFIPDNWVNPLSTTPTYGGYNYSTNNWSLEDWEKLEQSGVLFLPAAGLTVKNNKGTQRNYKDVRGLYHTATFYNKGSYSSEDRTYFVWFGFDGYNYYSSYIKKDNLLRNAISVRLVKDK